LDEESCSGQLKGFFYRFPGKTIKPVNIKEQRRPSYITVKIPLEEVAEAKRMEIMKRAEEAALAMTPELDGLD
jgi:hypothetical protein